MGKRGKNSPLKYSKQVLKYSTQNSKIIISIKKIITIVIVKI